MKNKKSKKVKKAIKNKKHKFNTCPNCGVVGELRMMHDAYAQFEIDEKGNYRHDDIYYTAVMDDCFLGCFACGQTSQDNEKLKKLFDEI